MLIGLRPGEQCSNTSQCVASANCSYNDSHIQICTCFDTHYDDVDEGVCKESESLRTIFPLSPCTSQGTWPCLLRLLALNIYWCIPADPFRPSVKLDSIRYSFWLFFSPSYKTIPSYTQCPISGVLFSVNAVTWMKIVFKSFT